MKNELIYKKKDKTNKGINEQKIFSRLLFLFLVVFLFSCEERIDINTEASEPRLIIYGYITTDTTQHAIRVTRSTGYFSTEKPQGISNAQVSISYGDETFPLAESDTEPGLYLTQPDVFGIAGETYTLHVSLDFDGNGEQENYEAVSYLPHPILPDSIALQTTSFYDKLFQLVFWGRLPDEEDKNDFSFHLYINNKLYNDSLQGFNTGDDKYLKGKELNGLPIFFLDQDEENEKVVPGDTLTVQVESVTHEYATFIENAQSESRGSIPLLSGPPANVETNIESKTPGTKIKISGFFTAYSKSQVTAVHY